MNTGAQEFVPSWLKANGAGVSTTTKKEEQETTGGDRTAAVPIAVTSAEELVTTAGDGTAEVPTAVSELEAIDDLQQKVDHVNVQDSTQAREPSGETGRYQREIAAGDTKEEVRHQHTEDRDEEGSDGRETVNLVFIGHVDAGKSTIGGQILVLTGEVDERTMEKYEKDAKAAGRESWKYAWALDLNPQEREKGKTEECGRASFLTPSRRFVILDAPGHKAFVPHMIGGASQADVAILIISARRGEFETGFERGGQTREHAMLAKTCGVRQLVVVINKMDDPSIASPTGQWSEERYEECRRKLGPFLKQVGWKPSEITWLPLSGLTGVNMKDLVPDSTCPWYKGESLLDTLDRLKQPERPKTGPIRLPIFEKYKDMGTIVMGKLECGTIRTNQQMVMMPNKVTVAVEGITLENTDVSVAEPGDNLRLRLRGIEEEEIRAGFVLCAPPDNLVGTVQSFNAKLMILEHKSIIAAGYSAVLHIHAAVEEFVIEKLIGEVDKKTGELARRNIKFAKPGMTVVARIRFSGQPVCMETFKDFQQLGRFMVRSEGVTVAVGVVLKLVDLA